MSMLMCWQWLVVQREAVLLSPNRPGTEGILSRVRMQLCSNTASLCSHSTAHALPVPVLSLANFIYIFIDFHMCKKDVQERLCLHVFEEHLHPCDHVLIGSRFKNLYCISMDQGGLATGAFFSSDSHCYRM